jgi:uncharacterized protein with FMN-binding domain
MKKKIIIVVSVLLAVLLAAFLFMVVIPEHEYNTVRNMKISNIDLTKIDDGVYNGEYAYGHYTYKVEIQVNNHKITEISVVSGGESKQAKMAEGVTDRIISEQKIDVDVISGATTTSKAILKAVENALSIKDADK